MEKCVIMEEGAIGESYQLKKAGHMERLIRAGATEETLKIAGEEVNAQQLRDLKRRQEEGEKRAARSVVEKLIKK